MTLIFARRALRRHIVLILVTVFVIAGAGIAVGYSWPKTYTSQAQILLGLNIAKSTIDPQTANLYLKDRVMTYAQLVIADEVIAPVSAATGLSPAVLRERVVGTIVPETVVLGVSATGSTPEEAVVLTQALSTSFQTQVSALNVRTGGPAILPAQLSSPQLAVAPNQLYGKMLIGVSVLAGLLIGALLALILGLVDATHASRRAANRSGELKATPTSTSTKEPFELKFDEAAISDSPPADIATHRRGRGLNSTVGVSTRATTMRTPERTDRALERRTNGSQTVGRDSG